MTEHEHNNETQCVHCNGTVTDEELVARYAGFIAEHGWGAVAVFGEDEPAWLYTVGLQETYGHPEIVMYGLEPQMAHSLVADAIEIIKKGGRLEPGTLVDEVIRDYSVAVVKVDEPLDPRYPLNMCTFFTDLDEIAAVQLVWPTADGVFPWQEGGQKEQAVLGTWSA